MELADCISIVNMFSDTWAGIIVDYVHHANGFDSVRKTDWLPIGFLRANHLFGYTQISEIALLTAASTSFASSSVRARSALTI
ncbi:MAG: hypothetical protein VR65_23805 [Desulfobulbaceae bacterium BRH_c16a]|nr:MAG: hypothetical protein VR65_23805 [Desulfobulbaceae bacterium BRH_c16a]